MQLRPGDRLGPYELIGPLGRGGMGEVYRARDSRLGREVAIKILAAELAGDAQALARFEREGRAVAALSHPNIVALYDVGRDRGIVYAITELLEGTTLRERLQAGAIPASKALGYVRAVAEAAAAAHARGIVHRDLKPENVFLTQDGRVKVLDFGIAQLEGPLRGDAHTTGATAAAATGASVLGTIGYMAPEQVRGLPTDARTDVFALGTLLYELLTGGAAFARDTPADTVSAILSADPAELPRIGTIAGAPVERIVRRCLEKNAEERFQSARDLSFALEAVAAGTGTNPAPDASPLRSGSRPRWLLPVVSTVSLVAMAGSYFAGRANAPVPRVMPAALFSLPANIEWFDAASVSPDGRYIAYTGGRAVDNQQATGMLTLRAVDSTVTRPLTDSRDAQAPLFWSPDSRYLGYFVNTTVVVREIPSGSPRKIAELPERAWTAAWGKDAILVGTPTGIYRLNASGGTPSLLMHGDPAHEVWRTVNSFLPDGKRFLYTVLRRSDSESALETRAASLAGQDLGAVTTGAVGARYADGHLFYGSNGRLMARAFDAAHLTLSGEPRELASEVSQNWRTGFMAASPSEAGVVVYRTAPQNDTQFTWTDRSGRRIGTVGAADSYTNFDVSADGKRIAATRRDPKTNINSLVVIDAERGVTTPITPSDQDDFDDPTWMPDGRRLAFRHGDHLVIRVADGGDERIVVNGESYPDHVTRDGRYLTYGKQRSGVYEAWAVDIDTPGAKPISLVPNVTLSDETRFSKNEKWIAYSSNQSGSDQVWIIPFPPTGEKWQISPNGGLQPRWSADGNELFYLNMDGYLMAVSIPDGDPRRAGQPRALFPTGLVPSNALDQIAVVGDRFVLRLPANARGDVSAPLQVLVNWRAR